MFLTYNTIGISQENDLATIGYVSVTSRLMDMLMLRVEGVQELRLVLTKARKGKSDSCIIVGLDQVILFVSVQRFQRFSIQPMVATSFPSHEQRLDVLMADGSRLHRECLFTCLHRYGSKAILHPIYDKAGWLRPEMLLLPSPNPDRSCFPYADTNSTSDTGGKQSISLSPLAELLPHASRRPAVRASRVHRSARPSHA